MTFIVIILYLGLCVLGLALNSVTLTYIVKRFKIGIRSFRSSHVFTLIFVEALLSTSGCAVSTILHFLVVVEAIQISFAYCSNWFISVNFPLNLGSFLTLQIAAIRFYLTKKSSHNEHPSKTRVTLLSLAIFFVLLVANLSYAVINETLDIPYSFFVEACKYLEREPR
jgi:hypothetical protein